MVRWYEKIVRCAAKHHLMINFHGAFKPTGMNRTWPNQITREGIRGNERNKFHQSVTPIHCATLPFTRYLLGPGDFTPGSFGNRHAAEFVNFVAFLVSAVFNGMTLTADQLKVIKRQRD